MYAKGYDMVTEIPKHNNVKTRQCKKGRKVLGAEQNPEDNGKSVILGRMISATNKMQKNLFY